MTKRKKWKNKRKLTEKKRILVKAKFSKWSKTIKKRFMNLTIAMSACVMTMSPRLNLLSKNKSRKKKKFTIMIKKCMKRTSKFKNFKKLKNSWYNNWLTSKDSTSKKPKNWNKPKKTTNVSNSCIRLEKIFFWIYKMKS